MPDLVRVKVRRDAELGWVYECPNCGALRRRASRHVALGNAAIHFDYHVYASQSMSSGSETPA